MNEPLYIITNRKLYKKREGLKVFGKEPNPAGPKELRLVSVKRNANGDWEAKELADKLKQARVAELKKDFNLDIDVRQGWYASLEVACEVFKRATNEKKSILFLVHGYNNDVDDVVRAAMDLQDQYGVIVVPFTWPANGGGKFSGTASYLSDKSDARVSTGALNRTVEKIAEFHQLLTMAQSAEHRRRATAKHPDNREAAYAYFTELVERSCSTRISMLCHSMGNYVLKHTLTTSDNQTSKLVFDNVCLVAADTNNHDHSSWVDKMDARNRLYIVINENDHALKASRIKPGNEQRSRLGHYLKNLNSDKARYINVTDAHHVGSDHAYFKRDAVDKNPALKSMFEKMFNGESAEQLLDYQPDVNAYRLK